jgi:hypothetical protein
VGDVRALGAFAGTKWGICVRASAVTREGTHASLARTAALAWRWQCLDVSEGDGVNW